MVLVLLRNRRTDYIRPSRPRNSWRQANSTWPASVESVNRHSGEGRNPEKVSN